MNPYNDLPSGETIAGRYSIEEKLGQGRSSAVYRALDAKTQTRVALKVLDPFLARDPINLERFRREATIIRQLDHPNVIKVFDLLADGDLHVIVMEYVDGIDAAGLIEQRGPIALNTVLSMAREMLSATEACHRGMILHRDIKPQNVLIDTDGHARLVDFGISKINTMSDLTKTGTAIGSPEYMAPELFRSNRSDVRTDIYALGAVLYELLTGRPPYIGLSLADIITQQLESEIDCPSALRPDLPEWLDTVVLKCLRLDPDERYQSAAAVREELERGARALATYESRNEPAVCLNCGVRSISGLGFCWDCGVLATRALKGGPFSIVLYRAGDPALLTAYLARNFPGTQISRLRRALRRGSALLCRGLSRESANHLCDNLVALRCEISAVRSLPRELRLPGWSLALALVTFAALYGVVGASVNVIQANTYRHVTTGAAALAAGLAAALCFFRLRTRPMIPIGVASSPSSSDASLAELARDIGRIHRPELRRQLGHLVACSLQLHGDPSVAQRVDLSAVKALVAAAIAAAARLEPAEAYLENRSLMGIADRLEATKLRLGAARDTVETAHLSDAKRELEEELKAYRETQERCSRGQIALQNARSALEKLRNSVQFGEAAGVFEGDLRGAAERLEYETKTNPVLEERGTRS